MKKRSLSLAEIECLLRNSAEDQFYPLLFKAFGLDIANYERDSVQVPNRVELIQDLCFIIFEIIWSKGFSEDNPKFKLALQAHHHLLSNSLMALQLFPENDPSASEAACAILRSTIRNAKAVGNIATFSKIPRTLDAQKAARARAAKKPPEASWRDGFPDRVRRALSKDPSATPKHVFESLKARDPATFNRTNSRQVIREITRLLDAARAASK